MYNTYYILYEYYDTFTHKYDLKYYPNILNRKENVKNYRSMFIIYICIYINIYIKKYLLKIINY